MKKVLAHSEKDAQKRRAAFEERYAVFSGHHLSLEGIKRKVNPNLEIKYLCYYLGESNKFSGKLYRPSCVGWLPQTNACSLQADE